VLFFLSWYTVLSNLIRLRLYLNANNLSGYVSIYYINQIGFWDVWFIVGADTFYLRYICGYLVEIHYSRSHILSMYNYLWRKDLSNIKILVLQMHAIILICVFCVSLLLEFDVTVDAVWKDGLKLRIHEHFILTVLPIIRFINNYTAF